MADDHTTQPEARKPLTLDPGQNESDLMLPIPSSEQDILWSRLDEAVGEKELTRELQWVKTPLEIRQYLASSDVAKRIQRIAETHKLSSTQAQELVRLARYVFIKETDFKNVIVAVFENLKTDRETAKKIGEDVKRELFVPQRDYLLTLFGGEPKESARPVSAPAAGTPPAPPQASLPPRETPRDPSLAKEKSPPVPPAASRPLEPERKNFTAPSLSSLPPREQPPFSSAKSWEDRFTSVVEPLDAPRGVLPFSRAEYRQENQGALREKSAVPEVKPAPILRKVPDVSPTPPKTSFTIDSVNKKPSQDMGKIIPEAPRPGASLAPHPSSPAPEPAHFRSVPQYGLASTLKNLRDAEEPSPSRESGKQSSPPSPQSGGGVQLDDLYNKVKSQGAPSQAVPPGAPSPSSASLSRDTGNFIRTMKGDLEATKSPSRISNS